MSTTTTTPSTALDAAPDLDALRARQQQVWSSGDYNRIAAITVPVAEALVASVGVYPGSTVLDVATGTGHAALAAARQGARVTGIDYVPSLLDIARRRAAAEQLDVELVETPAEHLPFPDESFDAVVSSIGVMFAADHQQAADELVRTTRVGGRIGLASWTPDSFIGGMLGIVGRHVPPPAGAQSPVRWGVEETVAGLLGNDVGDVASTRSTVRQRFTGPEQFADLFLAYYGPTHSAAKRLTPEGASALRADLVDHARSWGRRYEGLVDGLVIDWDYLIVTANRR